MCRRVGNTGKMGALFGILYAIGAPVPNSPIRFTIMQLYVKIKNILSGEQCEVIIEGHTLRVRNS